MLSREVDGVVKAEVEQVRRRRSWRCNGSCLEWGQCLALGRAKWALPYTGCQCEHREAEGRREFGDECDLGGR